MAGKSFGLKNFFFSFVTVCIVLYVFQNSNGSVKTMVAEEGSLEDIINADGVVIKNEEVYYASLNGSVTYYKKDGDKVKGGVLVADLNTDENSAQIRTQIDEIQSVIEEKSSKGIADSGVQKDLKKDSLKINENEIQSSLFNNNIEDVYKLAKQVNNDGAQVYENSKYESYDISQLKSLKASLTKSLNTHKISYYSALAGIICYKIDGLEETYNYDDVLNIKPSSVVKKDYEISDKSKNNKVEIGDKLYKIVRNFDYYIAAVVDNEHAKLFEKNKYVKTRIICDGKDNELWGYIKKINYGSEESVLVLYFDDYFYKIFDKRYVELQLITDIHKGFKIDKKALIKKDGIDGVYIKDASNIVKFFPVKILGENNTDMIISLGEYVSDDERRVIKISEKTYQTVKIFDKIILEPNKVYEGQIVK